MPIGLTGFMLISVLISLRFFFNKFFLKKYIILGFEETKVLITILSLFCIYYIITAFISPFLFQGEVNVFPPGDKFIHGSVKVNPSISNIAQIIYISLYFIFVMWVIQESSLEKNKNLNYYKFLFIGACFGIFFSFLQLLHKTLGFYFPMEMLYDMPRRAGNQVDAILFGIAPRINGSFSEASDAARYFTSIFSASLMSTLFFKKTIYKAIFILSSLCLLMALSSTGIIAGFIIILTFIIIRSFSTYIPNLIINRSLPKIIPSTIIIIISIIFTIYLTKPEIIDNSLFILNKLTFEKVNSGSFESRTGKDLIAFDILSETYLLGIGAGSHRSGSLMWYVLSNSGIIGFMLFFIFLVILLIVTFNNRYNGDIVICSSAFYSFILAKTIAGPGVADDILWFTLFILLASINKIKIYESIQIKK